MGGIMWGLIFAISIASGAVFMQQQQRVQKAQLDAQTEAISGSLMLYRNLVNRYAAANPTVTGVVADANLNLPTWYTKPSGISNYIVGAKGYVYYLGAGANTEIAYRLLKKSNNSLLAGINRGGSLYNPIAGTTTIAVPSQIPHQSVVYASH